MLYYKAVQLIIIIIITIIIIIISAFIYKVPRKVPLHVNLSESAVPKHKDSITKSKIQSAHKYLVSDVHVLDVFVSTDEVLVIHEVPARVDHKTPSTKSP